MSSNSTSLITARPPGLVDVLDRILDKGLVIAGDIKISLANVELLTVQIRLLICSIDKAEQIGLNWWRYDRNLTPSGKYSAQQAIELQERVGQLEEVVRKLNSTQVSNARKAAAGNRKRTRKSKRGGGI